MKKNNPKNQTTLKIAKSRDILPIEESAVDAFLFLYELEKANADRIRVELLPSFIADLAIEVGELKRLRDQILQ